MPQIQSTGAFLLFPGGRYCSPTWVPAIMAILEWVIITGVCLFISATLVNSANSKQQQQRLEQSFYRLLETENSCISLIQLAVAAKVDAEVTRRFLDEQVQAFKAEVEVDADGDTFYRFPKLRRSRS